ncbi:hypothetical protein V5O48_000923 [Marasmius crinis-equi]|uniref:Uncharacterized protein n=1 Tax=Marasmius crinis-equi TaxID=585013 RepID=A0ABR3FZY5_9AGAR
MAKTPKGSTSANTRTSRPNRASASVSFKLENEEMIDADMDTDPKRGDEEDLAAEMSKFLKEFRQQQAKKANMVNTAFENQKKAIYAAGRKRAQEASLMDLKKQEQPYDRCVSDIIPLWHDQDTAINKLLESYDRPVDELFPQRAETVAAAEQMLRENPARREKALKHFLSKAHEQLEESRKQEMAATDASNLIKHYKALLRN